jgi:adenylate cyclase, class 2
MSVEFEAKFLDINVHKMRKLLLENGSKMVHEPTKFIRAVFYLCDKNVKGYARVRQEKDLVTMTVKIYSNDNFPKEFEISINETFETGCNFLLSFGLEQKAYQESYREKWSHPLVHEITFDTLPGLPTYMEIDCTSEKNLDSMINLLNLDKSKMRYGAFDKTYNEYYGIPLEIINNNTPSLTFKNIEKEIDINKNDKLFKKISKQQKNINKYVLHKHKITKK